VCRINQRDIHWVAVEMFHEQEIKPMIRSKRLWRRYQSLNLSQFHSYSI